MDEVYDNSDSDQELENQELEVALYSQIHFDSGTQAEQWLDSNNYSYLPRSTPLRIGVKELPVRTTSCLKEPILCGEFIAFSQSKSEDDEGDSPEPHDLASSHQDKHEIFGLETTAVELNKEKPKGCDVKKQTLSSSTSEAQSSSVVKCHRDCSSSGESKKSPRSFQKSQVKSPVLEYKIDGHKLNSVPKDLTDVHKSHNEEGQHKKLIKEEIVKSTPKVKNLKSCSNTDLKEKELYLPYSVTKTTKNKKVTETACVSIEKETKEVQPAATGKKKATNSLAKLESYLKLPKSGAGSSVKQQKQKRTSLTKTDAAVKPRTPKFFVRRPPATVVKYRQDSDTNTDYSDSDVSNSSSPVKGKQKTSKDASVHSDSVCEDPKLLSKNTIPSVTESITQDKSETSIRAGHQADQFDKVSGNKPERVTTSSQDVSMDSEDEDESETDENTGDESDLQEVIAVESSGDSSSSSSQEEPATGSEDTDSSDSEEFMAENIPGLEFNLDGGVAGFAVQNPDSWKINEKDRFSINSALSRYFFPRSIQCRNCKVEGHLSRDCPKPLKRRCIFCGKDGHTHQACPDAICFNCSAPGHRFNECKEQKINRAATCQRCWISGHDDTKCSDRWRQYHITIQPKGHLLEKLKTKGIRNPLVFCYNCGKKGHLGYEVKRSRKKSCLLYHQQECRLPRMNKFTVAPYPFVARYDTKQSLTEMRQIRKVISKSPRTANLTDKRPEKHCSNRIKNKGFDRDERRQLKNKRRIQEHEDEYTHGSKKRRRSSREKADSKTGGGNNEKNHPVFVRNQRSDSGTFRRQEVGKGDMDDIFSDFGKHQVNDNEWWNRKSVKKRRKKNADISTPEFLGGDRQKDSPGDRERPRGKDITIFRGSRAHQFDSKRHGEERKRDKHLKSGPGKSKHGDFMPEFQFNQQVNHAYENSRVSNHREREVGNFASHKHSREYRSLFSNETSRLHGQHTIFQKQDSFFPRQQGGFQVRNDRFVAMEKNHNITVRFRK